MHNTIQIIQLYTAMTSTGQEYSLYLCLYVQPDPVGHGVSARALVFSASVTSSPHILPPSVPPSASAVQTYITQRKIHFLAYAFVLGYSTTRKCIFYHKISVLVKGKHHHMDALKGRLNFKRTSYNA